VVSKKPLLHELSDELPMRQLIRYARLNLRPSLLVRLSPLPLCPARRSPQNGRRRRRSISCSQGSGRFGTTCLEVEAAVPRAVAAADPDPAHARNVPQLHRAGYRASRHRALYLPWQWLWQPRWRLRTRSWSSSNAGHCPWTAFQRSRGSSAGRCLHNLITRQALPPACWAMSRDMMSHAVSGKAPVAGRFAFGRFSRIMALR